MKANLTAGSTNRLVCPHCLRASARVEGSVIYPHRPDLHAKWFYLCAPCGAYVGCHPGTTTPLGTPANAELRAARQRAHGVFDPLWKSGVKSRTEAYKVLAAQLGIPVGSAHIGMFNLEQCERVVAIYEVQFDDC